MNTGFADTLAASHAGGHWLESSSLYKKFLISSEIRNFFAYMARNSDAVFSRFLLDPNADPKAEMTGVERIASSAPLPTIFLWLHRLTDDVSDGVSGVTLHIRRGVGVGAEREACIVVSQRTGQRLDVHAVLEGQRGEGVSEIMEAYMLRTDGFQYFFVGVTEGVRVKHGAGLGRYE